MPECCDDRLNSPNMSRSNIPSAWRKRASNPRWAASATLMISGRVLAQCYGRDRQWSLQSRGHSPARAVALVRGRRDRYSGMGRLVQQPAAPGAHRKHPAGRSRGTPLRHAGAVRHGGVTQTKWPPPNPTRFMAARGSVWRPDLLDINPHFPSSVDIQCGEKAILL